MVDKKPRTYELREDTINWIDEFSEENDADKRDVVERAIRVYAAKLAKDEWKDPKFKSSIDKQFSKLR